jgi:sugar/nucleoside kinase (ribokinase family)
MDIVVVGSVALDTVETPWGGAEEALGGSATFFSLTASHYAEVGLVAVVGEDLPASARALLERRKVDMSGLKVESGGKCFRWGGRYHADVNRRDTLFTHLNVFEHFHPQLPDNYREGGLLFLANIHPSLQLEVLKQARAPRMVAVDTMNLWIDTARDALVEVLSRVDLVFLNDEEVRLLSRKHALPEAVAAVQAMGPARVVVKKGEHGAILFDGSQRFALPALVLDRVVDPTGAGDTFAGGFLGHLARSENWDHATLREAMVQGTVMASFATEQFSVGGLDGLVPEAIAARREELRKLTDWPS